jgi:hypothetical protein
MSLGSALTPAEAAVLHDRLPKESRYRDGYGFPPLKPCFDPATKKGEAE